MVIAQKTSRKRTTFIFDFRAMPEHYPDKHYHLQFPIPKPSEEK
jgi:hypothetical protein